MEPSAWTPSVWLGLMACAGILGLGLLVLVRGAQSPLAPPLALLCIDMFLWNFFTVAATVSGAPAWSYLDVTFSPFTPPLALHVVLVFVGRLRALRWLLVLAYLAFGALSLSAASAFFGEAGRVWARSGARSTVFLVLWLPLVALELVLLVRHWRSSTSFEEQWRARLVIAAVVVGAALGSTDMCDQFVAVPALGYLGALGSMAIMAVVVLRFRLFGEALPLSVAIYALSVATLGTVAYLAAFRWLATNAALLTIVTVSLTLALFAAVRDAVSSVMARREQLWHLASLGRVTAQMAHDIKNPLSALKGAVQLLQQDEAQGRTLEDKGEFLQLIQQQVQRLEAVVDTYQRLSRVEPARGPVQLNEVVQGVLDQAALSLKQGEAGVRIERALGEQLPVLQADRDLLAGALENVVRNAIEAMPRGGTLGVSTSFHRIDRQSGMLCVKVEDGGEGMDARAQERAFDSFFTTKAEGRGIGLPFVRRVVEAHQGEVRLSSRPGRGTVVELLLPAETLDRDGGERR